MIGKDAVKAVWQHYTLYIGLNEKGHNLVNEPKHDRDNRILFIEVNCVKLFFSLTCNWAKDCIKDCLQSSLLSRNSPKPFLIAPKGPWPLFQHLRTFWYLFFFVGNICFLSPNVYTRIYIKLAVTSENIIIIILLLLNHAIYTVFSNINCQV